MPYHYEKPSEKKNSKMDKKVPKKPKKKKEIAKKSGGAKNNLINKSSLGSSNKKKLMGHAVYHTKNHLNFMINKIENGKKFSEAHLLAQKSIGR